jgi:SAM-dependent methyltransferase
MKPGRTSPNSGVDDRPLLQRYGPEAISVFDAEERCRFFDADGRPLDEVRLRWELLYRLEPALYERLIAGERLNPSIVEWLPASCARAVELGAGTGRLTLDLAERCGRLTATEPAMPLLSILERKLVDAGMTEVAVARGFFDSIPLASSSCDLVISCSAFTPTAERDPEACLIEMRRCAAPGGLIVVVWPNSLPWLGRHGFTRVEFPGAMAVDFGTRADALELTRIFYPTALEDVRSHDSPTVPYEMLGMNPPRDLCWMRVE